MQESLLRHPRDTDHQFLLEHFQRKKTTTLVVLQIKSKMASLFGSVRMSSLASTALKVTWMRLCGRSFELINFIKVPLFFFFLLYFTLPFSEYLISFSCLWCLQSKWLQQLKSSFPKGKKKQLFYLLFSAWKLFIYDKYNFMLSKYIKYLQSKDDTHQGIAWGKQTLECHIGLMSHSHSLF